LQAFDLDALGWHDFELLVQAMLKRLAGLGVEAWGGHSDLGRDAYFEGPLRFPTTDLASGPFVFQCKFVEQANAAGATPFRLVEAASRKEAARIEGRLKPTKRGQNTVPPKWSTPPNHFALYTNAPLSGVEKERIAGLFKSRLNKCAITIHDFSDVCATLLNTPDLARSFPQLLSLRDLEGLFKVWIRPDIANRSQAAIAQAAEVSAVFVPTKAYFEALDKLRRFGFVVLEGPPEMGKTAIGRMVGLAHLAIGWEMVECKSPSDMLTKFQRDIPQVFVADDFFGRTEYNPARISHWQADLPNILSHLDRQHWLILTSRAHLLAMAKHTLDVSGANARFPELGEVVVDAGRLTEIEKAKILYRHAKRLPSPSKAIIKEEAEKIVENAHYTPLRIRLLMTELTIRMGDGPLSKAAAIALIHDTLQNPSREMQASFRALPLAHKWLLFAMLESDGAPGYNPRPAGRSDLRARYERLCPPAELEDYQRMARELSESFVTGVSTNEWVDIDWIHPSCRDLAIDELSAAPRERQHFIANCDRQGVHLATSIGGGPTGKRVFPLLRVQADIRTLRARILELLPNDLDVVEVLHANLEAAGREGIQTETALALLEILREVLPTWRSNLVDTGRWNPDRVNLYVGVSRMLGASVSLPDIGELAKVEGRLLQRVLHRTEKLSEATNNLRQLIGLAALALDEKAQEIVRQAFSNGISELNSWLTSNEALTDEERQSAYGTSYEYEHLCDELDRTRNVDWLFHYFERDLDRLIGEIGDRRYTLELYEEDEADEVNPPVDLAQGEEEASFSISSLFEDL
jgi:hypothetical protein